VTNVVKVLDHLDLATKNCNIVIHAMSNNGGYFYAKLLSTFTQNSKYKHLHELIIGTTAEAFPGVEDKDMRVLDVLSGRDLTASGGKKPVLSIIDWINPIAWFVSLIQWVAWIFLYLSIFMRIGDGFTWYKKQISDPVAVRWPVLVLFTEADFVVPASQIEPFWKSVKQDVTLHKIAGDDVNHVQALLKRPDEYKKAIQSFLNKIQQ
jgi:hypothetical protein